MSRLKRLVVLALLISPVAAAAEYGCPNGMIPDDFGECVSTANPNPSPTALNSPYPVTQGAEAAQGACPSGYIEEYGQCYKMDTQTGQYTRDASVLPSNTVKSGISAQPTGSGLINMRFIEGYKNDFVNIVNNYLIPALMALALLVFFWGVYKYFIYGGENEHEKGEGRKFALWGVIGFAIIVSVWGLVNIITDTFIPSGTSINAPKTPKL